MGFWPIDRKCKKQVTGWYHNKPLPHRTFPGLLSFPSSPKCPCGTIRTWRQCRSVATALVPHPIQCGRVCDEGAVRHFATSQLGTNINSKYAIHNAWEEDRPSTGSMPAGLVGWLTADWVGWAKTAAPTSEDGPCNGLGATLIFRLLCSYRTTSHWVPCLPAEQNGLRVGEPICWKDKRAAMTFVSLHCGSQHRQPFRTNPKHPAAQMLTDYDYECVHSNPMNTVAILSFLSSCRSITNVKAELKQNLVAN